MNRYRPLILLITALLLAPGCTSNRPRQGDTNLARQVDLYVRMGLGYMGEQKYEIANRRLTRALELDPDSTQANNAMALLQQRLRENDEAERYYRRALEIDPRYSSAHNNYGRLLCETGRPAEAEEHFRAAAGNPLYPRADMALVNAGLCAARSGKHDQAIAFYREALQRNPRNSSALVHMAEYSLERDQALSARGYLQRYQEVSRHTAHSLWLGYQIETRLGDREAAADYALRLRGNFPDAAETTQLGTADSP